MILLVAWSITTTSYVLAPDEVHFQVICDPAVKTTTGGQVVTVQLPETGVGTGGVAGNGVAVGRVPVGVGNSGCTITSVSLPPGAVQILLLANLAVAHAAEFPVSTAVTVVEYGLVVSFPGDTPATVVSYTPKSTLFTPLPAVVTLAVTAADPHGRHALTAEPAAGGAQVGVGVGVGVRVAVGVGVLVGVEVGPAGVAVGGAGVGVLVGVGVDAATKVAVVVPVPLDMPEIKHDALKVVDPAGPPPGDTTVEYGLELSGPVTTVAIAVLSVENVTPLTDPELGTADTSQLVVPPPIVIVAGAVTVLTLHVGIGVGVGVGADTFTVHVAKADNPLRSARTRTVFVPLVL